MAILDEWISKNGLSWWVFPGVSKHVHWCLRSRHSATPHSELKAACRALRIEPPVTCEQLRGSLARPRSNTIGTAPPFHIFPPASAPHSEQSEDLLAPELVAVQPELVAKLSTENPNKPALSGDSIAAAPSEADGLPPSAVAPCPEAIGHDLKTFDPPRTPQAKGQTSDAPVSLDPERTLKRMLYAARSALMCGVAAEQYAIARDSANDATAWSWFSVFVELAVTLDKMFAQDFSLQSLHAGAVPFAAILEYKALALAWTATRSQTGVAKSGLKSGTQNEADWDEVLKYVDPLRSGCAEQYYRLCKTAFRLLSALGEKEDERFIPWVTTNRDPKAKNELPVRTTDEAATTPYEPSGHEGEDAGPPPLFELPYLTALATKLRKAGRAIGAMLVAYMADKTEATVEAVAEHVHGNAETREKTIYANVRRTNDWLIEQGERLSFKMASGYVFREISAK
jgi:hypothetical protein